MVFIFNYIYDNFISRKLNKKESKINVLKLLHLCTFKMLYFSPLKFLKHF